MRHFSFDSNIARDYYWKMHSDPNISYDVKVNMHRFINDVRKVAIDTNDDLPRNLSVGPIDQRYENEIRKFFTQMGFEITFIRFLTLSTAILITPL